MNPVISFIQAHPTSFALGSFWVFSAAVSSMPMPADNSSPFYKWVFGFGHTLAGSIARVVAMKYPQYQNGNSEPKP